MPGSSFHWIGSDLVIKSAYKVRVMKNYSTGYMGTQISVHQPKRGPVWANVFLRFHGASDMQKVLLNLAEATL